MITIEDSLPKKNDGYLLAEDVFFIQFNDISIYIEDEEQENFYYNILCKLFPNIQIEKIFPLNGKDNVITDCKNNPNDKKKIYIVDKDFDDIFNRKEKFSNLFYLNRYSIENYLLETESLIDYIISEKPKLKRKFIIDNLRIEDCIETIREALNNLIYLFLLVQKKCPRLKNVSLNYERFFDFNNGNFSVRQDQIDNYCLKIINELSETDKRLRLNSQIKKIKSEITLVTNNHCIKHYPGKFIINMLKQIIESFFGLKSRNMESFCYRLASNCNFNSLEFLKLNINAYLN